MRGRRDKKIIHKKDDKQKGGRYEEQVEKRGEKRSREEKEERKHRTIGVREKGRKRKWETDEKR